MSALLVLWASLADFRTTVMLSEAEGSEASRPRMRPHHGESYDDFHKALARETQLKDWIRAKKIVLIVRRNPRRVDLAADWYPWMRKEGRDASTAQVRLAALSSLLRVA